MSQIGLVCVWADRENGRLVELRGAKQLGDPSDLASSEDSTPNSTMEACTADVVNGLMRACNRCWKKNLVQLTYNRRSIR